MREMMEAMQTEVIKLRSEREAWRDAYDDLDRQAILNAFF